MGYSAFVWSCKIVSYCLKCIAKVSLFTIEFSIWLNYTGNGKFCYEKDCHNQTSEAFVSSQISISFHICLIWLRNTFICSCDFGNILTLAINVYDENDISRYVTCPFLSPAELTVKASTVLKDWSVLRSSVTHSWEKMLCISSNHAQAFDAGL